MRRGIAHSMSQIQVHFSGAGDTPGNLAMAAKRLYSCEKWLMIWCGRKE